MAYKFEGKTHTFGKSEVKKEDKLLEFFLHAFEEGIIPWESGIIKNAFNSPSRGKSGEYTGINIITTYLSRLFNKFDSDTFLTFDEIKKRGGSVKKGEKSTPIAFPTFLYYVGEKQVKWKDWKHAKDVGEEETYEKFVGYHIWNVYNLAQTNLEYEHLAIDFSKNVRKCKSAESIIKCYADCPKIEVATSIIERGADGCYSPSLDTVTIPPMSAFKSKSLYYSTLFHELIHSTEVESRCNCTRKKGGFGSDEYAWYELRAEIGASILMAKTNLKPCTDRSKAYVQSWGQRFKDIPNFTTWFTGVFKSAMNGADYILGNLETKSEVA